MRESSEHNGAQFGAKRINTRRVLLVAIGGATFIPRVLLAQSTQTPVLIGWLEVGSRKSTGHRLSEFKQGLAALGWKEGANYVLEERWAEGRRDRLQPLAEELAAKKPALIVAAPIPSVAAAAKAAPTTPIVQTSGGDLVAAGLVASLARPGGMITGSSNVAGDVAGKHIELLLEAVPGLRRVGFLADSAASRGTVIEGARRSIARHAVEGRIEEAANLEGIEPALSRLATHKVQALIIMASPLFAVDRSRILKLALGHRWPVIGNAYEFAEAGALISYSADILALYRRAAYYVDRILKGTKPADLPVEQPTTFECVVNLKTAKTLGITIPASVMIQATRVIK